MVKIQMRRSEALEWVKLAIERERYQAALDILNDLIKQERELENKEVKDGS